MENSFSNENSFNSLINDFGVHYMHNSSNISNQANDTGTDNNKLIVRQFSPSMLYHIIANDYLLPESLRNVISIKGIYIKTNNGYDILKDIGNDSQIKIIVDNNKRVNLIDNAIYTCIGVLSSFYYKSGLYYKFHVNEISEIEEEQDNRLQQINELLRIASNNNSKRPSEVIWDNLRNQKKTRFLCVFPVRTETKNEFYNHISGCEKVYEFEDRHINFTDVNSFSLNLNGFDRLGFDVIIIMRGGGEGTDFFSNLDIIRIIIEMKTPLLLGVGHQDTNILLRSFVKEWKANPTATGIYLRDLARNWNETFELTEKNKELKTENEKQKRDIENYIKRERLSTEKNDGLQKSLTEKTEQNSKTTIELNNARQQLIEIEKQLKQIKKESNPFFLYLLIAVLILIIICLLI